ncbi:MAG TPA: glycosyltransferase, partial [Nitrosospira sp.]|nr:glycosyltransferase [Nitrosospira sp.]
KLFYYARPGTPRNGFEIAVTALQQLKQEFGDSLDIVCAGADWNPADYGLDGAVRNIGLLPYEETGEIYRSVHVGLVMMMTKHPSYLPLELMASGAVVVSNYNPATTWLLKNGENCLLSAPTASCLAATLRYALDNYEQLASLRKRAAFQILADAGDWETSLGEVASFILKPPNQSVQSNSAVRALLPTVGTLGR